MHAVTLNYIKPNSFLFIMVEHNQVTKVGGFVNKNISSLSSLASTQSTSFGLTNLWSVVALCVYYDLYYISFLDVPMFLYQVNNCIYRPSH